MATISHLPFSFSFPCLEFRKPLFYQPQIFVSHLTSTKKHGFVCFACSIKQTRVRKRVKSNEELRSEMMEFVALAGLPEGHLPSMKELSAHGRVDLANIVRRRGYKFMKELLANSDMVDCNELVCEQNTNMEASETGFCLENSLIGQGKGIRDEVDRNLVTEPPSNSEIDFTATNGSVPLDPKENNFDDVITNSRPEAEEHGTLSKDESSLAGVLSMEKSFSDFSDSNRSGEITENKLKIESVELNNRADIENSSSEASISANHSLILNGSSSCADREADNVFVAEDGEVNNANKDFSLTYVHYTSPIYDHYTSPTYNHITSPDLNYNEVVDISTESLSALTSENTISTTIIEEKTTRFIQNGYLDTFDDDENEVPNESCPEETKESVETTRSDEYIGDSYGGQRIVGVPPNGSSLSLEETMTQENQVEITRLRSMLRQKELELSRLKEQIEKEKLSLSALQRQAETEIQKAQTLISEKDVELLEAEESLSGLQEVVIEYCGDGNVVEVTGSFNGWQHRVGMELKASKSIGKQKCWSTLLWLYPGTYEIKFIVDGQWTTDPQKDSVTRGHITNNLLKVDS